MRAYTKSGTELRLASQTRGSQHGASVAGLAAGGFVATWTCLSGAMGEASGADVRAGLFDTGRPRGEFLVNTRLLDHQQSPALAGLSDGGFVVAWEDCGGPHGSSIKAKVFGPDALVIADEFPVDPRVKGEQSCPALAALSGGGFVIVWQQDAGRRGGTDVRLAVFDADGTGIGRSLVMSEASAGYQANPAVAALADGGFVVAWQDFSGRGGDRSAAGIKARLFGPDAEPWGPEFLVNTEIWNDQSLPAVAGLADGGFAVAWTCYSGGGGDASGTGIKARLYRPTGEPCGDEFLVNTETLNSQVSPALAGLADGGLVVAWTCYSGCGADRSGAGIKAKVFDGDGGTAGDEFLANTETSGDQIAPAVAALAGGGFVVAWQDAGGQFGGPTSVKAQVFTPAQVPLSALAGRRHLDEGRPRAA